MKPSALAVPLAFVSFLLLPSFARAAVLAYSTTLDSYEHYHLYTDTDAASTTIFLDDVNISGLSRFNSALGNLDAIKVGVFGGFSTDAYFSVEQDDVDSPFSAQAEGLSDHSFLLVVWDSTTNKGHGEDLGSVFPYNDLQCSGVTDDGFCDDGISEYWNIDTLVDITSSANMSDFLGIGPLDSGTLTFGVTYPEALSFITDNVYSADVDIGIYNEIPIDIELQYHYSPVPLPAAFWLMVSGVGLLLGLNRRHRAAMQAG